MPHKRLCTEQSPLQQANLLTLDVTFAILTKCALSLGSDIFII